MLICFVTRSPFVFSSQPRLDIPDEKKRAFERSCPTDVDDIKAKIILLEKELKTMPQISENDRNAAFDAQKKLELAEKDKDEISASVQKLIQQLKE